jgi:hypothetical protein
MKMSWWKTVTPLKIAVSTSSEFFFAKNRTQIDSTLLSSGKSSKPPSILVEI